MKNNEIIKKIIITKTKIFYSKLIYMHTFQDLDLKVLRKICSKYNLHVKIAKYSKLSKEELIPHMEKHLHITDQGKIKMREYVYHNINDELSKMIDELKNKVKEVKEKVKKQQTKKMMPKEEVKPEVKPVRQMSKNVANYEEKMKKAEEKAEVKVVDQMMENLGVKPKKEKKMKKVKPMKEDNERISNLKKNIKNHKETIKSLTKKNGYSDADIKKYTEEYNNEIEMYEDELKKEMKEMKKETPKEDHMKDYKEAKEKKLTIVEKVDNLQNELEKLEKMIKIDEKQNEMEHKQIKEEINEDDLFNKLTQKIFITPIEKIKKALIKLNYKGKMETNKMLLNMQLSKEFNTIEKIKKLLNELDDKEEIHEPQFQMKPSEPKTEKEKERYLIHYWKDDNLGYLFDNYDYHKGTGENITRTIDKLNAKNAPVFDTFLLGLTRKYNNEIVDKYGVKALFDGIKNLAEHYGAEKYKSMITDDIGFELPKGYLNVKNSKKVFDYVKEHRPSAFKGMFQMEDKEEAPKRTKKQSGEVIDFSKRVIRD
jgi:hypothetical protein